MKMYGELIVTGAWWDYVDDIASHRIGPILKDYPAPTRRKMLSWSKSGNLWKRRTAILCQSMSHTAGLGYIPRKATNAGTALPIDHKRTASMLFPSRSKTNAA